jgi:hypothetical protein
MPNYQNGKIYRITCNVTGEDYINCTTLALCQRIQQHRQEFKQYMNGTHKYYHLLHKVMDADDYELILLEQYPCNSKDDLNERRRYWEKRIAEEQL